MKIRRVLAVSILLRLSVVLACLFIVYANHLIGQRWFSDGSTPSEVQAALDKAVDVNALSEQGKTGLMWAAKRNDVELAEALVRAGANPNIQTQPQGGFTALMMAVSNGNYPKAQEIIELLLANNANARLRSYGTDRQNSGNTTPQFTSYIDTNFDDVRREVLSKLIKHGANINDQNDAGNTIAHLTVQQRNLIFMRELMDYFGPMLNLKLRNKAGKDVRGYAEYYNYTEMIPIIEQAVEPLKEVDQRDKNGLTGLMVATVAESMGDFGRWIKRGSNLNAQSKDEYQFTPLMLAIMHEQIPMVTKLLEAGTDRLKKDARGKLALQHVFRVTNPGERFKLAQLLLTQNPDPQLIARDKFGNVFLHEAVIADDLRMVEYILNTYPKSSGIQYKNVYGQRPYELAKKLKRADMESILRNATFRGR